VELGSLIVIIFFSVATVFMNTYPNLFLITSEKTMTQNIFFFTKVVPNVGSPYQFYWPAGSPSNLIKPIGLAHNAHLFLSQFF
jgi:hypothetical protein